MTVYSLATITKHIPTTLQADNSVTISYISLNHYSPLTIVNEATIYFIFLASTSTTQT